MELVIQTILEAKTNKTFMKFLKKVQTYYTADTLNYAWKKIRNSYFC